MRQIHEPYARRISIKNPRSIAGACAGHLCKRRGFSQAHRGSGAPATLRESQAIDFGLPNVYNQWFAGLRSGPSESEEPSDSRTKSLKSRFAHKKSTLTPLRDSCRHYSTTRRYCQHTYPAIYNLLTKFFTDLCGRGRAGILRRAHNAHLYNMYNHDQAAPRQGACKRASTAVRARFFMVRRHYTTLLGKMQVFFRTKSQFSLGTFLCFCLNLTNQHLFPPLVRPRIVPFPLFFGHSAAEQPLFIVKPPPRTGFPVSHTLMRDGLRI